MADNVNNKKRGPSPNRLVIDGKWETAIRRIFETAEKPKGGKGTKSSPRKGTKK